MQEARITKPSANPFTAPASSLRTPAWQPRIVNPPLQQAPPPAAPLRRLYSRPLRFFWRNRGYILRSLLRGGFTVLALLTMGPALAVIVIVLMLGSQLVLDEPKAPESSERPVLRSLP